LTIVINVPGACSPPTAEATAYIVMAQAVAVAILAAVVWRLLDIIVANVHRCDEPWQPGHAAGPGPGKHVWGMPGVPVPVLAGQAPGPLAAWPPLMMADPPQALALPPAFLPALPVLGPHYCRWNWTGTNGTYHRRNCSTCGRTERRPRGVVGPWQILMG
jgi:hypothetical protein